jgi:hypothetical protein
MWLFLAVQSALEWLVHIYKALNDPSKAEYGTSPFVLVPHLTRRRLFLSPYSFFWPMISSFYRSHNPDFRSFAKEAREISAELASQGIQMRERIQD